MRKAVFGILTATLGMYGYGGEPAVGCMLDVSRNKMPTMDSRYRMADVLAELGYNQFQLYTEHTFAYENHAGRLGGPSGGARVVRLADFCCGVGGWEAGVEVTGEEVKS